MRDNKHYRAIGEHYGRQTAVRSGVPLMAHIDEGLFILDLLGSSLRAKEAFCVHPMLQADEALEASLEAGSVFLSHSLDPAAVVLAMAYRCAANAYLSHHCRGESDVVQLSELKDVNDMLVADKVQNRKDFEIHHLHRHERSDILAVYFANWLRALGVSESRYQEMVGALAAKVGR